MAAPAKASFYRPLRWGAKPCWGVGIYSAARQLKGRFMVLGYMGLGWGVGLPPTGG